MRKAFQDIAQRLERAEANFIDTLMEYGDITRSEATRVFDLYRREKIIKRDAVGGVYNVVHGGFLDRDVIRRALAESASRSGGKKRHAKETFHLLNAKGTARCGAICRLTFGAQDPSDVSSLRHAAERLGMRACTNCSAMLRSGTAWAVLHEDVKKLLK